MSYASIENVAEDLFSSAELSLSEKEKEIFEWAEETNKASARQRQAKLSPILAVYTTKRQRQMVDDWIEASEKIAASSRLWSKVLAAATVALVFATGALVYVEYLRFAAGG